MTTSTTTRMAMTPRIRILTAVWSKERREKIRPLQQLLLSLRRDSSRSDTSLRPPGIAQRCWRSLRHLEQLLDLLLSQRLGERVLVQLIERGLLEEVQRAVRI